MESLRSEGLGTNPGCTIDGSGTARLFLEKKTTSFGPKTKFLPLFCSFLALILSQNRLYNQKLSAFRELDTIAHFSKIFLFQRH